jgi:F0F1-type ATP synthase membrane subunit b/b'
MDNTEVLGHLLQIESEAALLVNEAQAEADRRTTEAEQRNRAAFDERCRKESERLENEFLKIVELVRQRYSEEIEAYKNELSSIAVDNGRFSALLDRYLAEDI